jgi:hypothetical protein
VTYNILISIDEKIYSWMLMSVENKVYHVVDLEWPAHGRPHCVHFWLGPMRPKARRLAQYGGLPGWLKESDPEQGVILYLMPFDMLLNVHKTPS